MHTPAGIGGGELQDTTNRVQSAKWEFPKIGDPYFGVLIIGILPFRVLD